MITTENNDGKKWYASGDANHGGDANGGVATEGKGRERNPELYENDVPERAVKRKENNIWTRGGMKRTKYKKEDK